MTTQTLAATEVAVRLLGVLEVDRGGETVHIRGNVPRALLARLAWTPGETVTPERLVEDAWALPPASPVSAIRAYFSRLRAAALGDTLVGTRGGYLLAVPRDRVDVTALLDRAAALAAPRADEAHLAALAELAVQLDRELVTGLEGPPFLITARAQLAAVRRTVEEDLGETALALGDAALAVAVLEGTAARNPADERPALLLATALARRSRHSDAVDVLDRLGDAQRAAADLEVSPRVAALRSAIVRLEPEVVAPAPAGGGGSVERVGVQIPLTRYIGRMDVLARLRAARPTERLITIVGPAGVGKTRTAVELAREATTALDEEQYLVDLADVRRPEGVAAAIASTVRASEATTESVARRLAGRRVLLILDNADHVLGATAVAVAELLAAGDDVRVLVTSREALRLPAEFPVVLEPFGEDEVDDAWRLLVERATDARGDDPFDETEEEAARRLLADLDGIPLALELAAARLDVLDADAVRAGLGESAGDGRHGSVRNAIAWSFGLLEPDLQRALVHAGRFAGPFTVDAYAGVEHVPLDEARTTLDALVGRSLLSSERSDAARPRLRMLESMREYVATLDDGADAAEWTARHRRWFAGLVESIAPTLRAFEAPDTMAMLDGFRADLDAAMDSAAVAGDRASALRLAGGLAPYWHLRGRFAEGRARIDEAIALPAEEGDAPDPALPVAELELANLTYQLGDAPAGFVAIAGAEAHARVLGDATTLAVALARAAYGHSLLGDPATGRALIATSESLFDDAQPWARSEVLMCKGQILRGDGRLDDALTALTEAHRIASSVGYTWMVTSARYNLAKTLLDARRPREAVEIARSGAEWARVHEDAPGSLALLHVAAAACAPLERHDTGARLFGAIDALGVRYGYSTATAEGADAHRLRDAVAAGLPAGEFERRYRAGAELGWDEVLQLVGALPARA